MKIRTGFVANSSSSSFLIYGISKTEFQALFPDHDPVKFAEEKGIDVVDDYIGKTIIYSEYAEFDASELATRINNAPRNLMGTGLIGAKFYSGYEEC